MTEGALYESPVLRRFARVDLGRSAAPERNGPAAQPR